MDSIIFDVDGTIWDSTAECADVWSMAAEKFGAPYDHITGERLRSEFGKTADDIAISLFPDYTLEQSTEIIRYACEIENDWLLNHRPSSYDGIYETMEILSKKIPLFIVSNCQAGYIEVMLQITGLTPFITDHLCPGDTGEVKAANIRTIVEKHNLKAPIYVGDTAGDLAASREAGVRFAFAKYGFGSVKEFDASIDSPRDLLKLIEQ